MSEKGEISDGYHTFNELYEHRHSLFGALARAYGGWKSLNHHDSAFPMYPGWFIAGVELPSGSITYHLPMRLWVEFPGITLERAPEWDGHSPADVVTRLHDFWKGLSESEKQERQRMHSVFEELLPIHLSKEKNNVGFYTDDRVAELWEFFKMGHSLCKEDKMRGGAV